MSEFKVGDQVRVRKLDNYKTGAVGFSRPSMDNTIGQVGTVSEVRPTYARVQFGAPIHDYWNYEFDWIEKVREDVEGWHPQEQGQLDQPEPELKVGDRVKISGKSWGGDDQWTEGVIMKIDGDSSFQYHVCPNGTRHYCYNRDQLTLIEPPAFAPVLAEYEPVKFDGKNLTVPIADPDALRSTLNKLGVPKKDLIREEFLKLGWKEEKQGVLRRRWTVVRLVGGRWQWLSGTGLIDSVEKARAVDTMVGS